jgi:triacylglycerol lipase
MERLLGLKDLIHDVIEKTTDLVQETHRGHGLTAAAVYSTVRATNRGIRALGELGLGLGLARAAAAPALAAAGPARAAAAPALAAAGHALAAAAPAGAATAPDEPAGPALTSAAFGSLPWWLDTAQSVVNASHGDFLAARGNRLAIAMGLRHRGRELPIRRDALAEALPDATGKLAVFVHGLGCTEWEWCFRAHDHYGDAETTFGTLLGRDLGYTPLYLRYNSGLHVSENGRRLAQLLTELCAAFPRPVEQIALLGHSMGGLVARSAAHYGAQGGAPWIDRLGHVVCIATPHLGAPLEKGVNLLASLLRRLDSAGATVPARILDSRSAGIKDMRFGYVVDEDWRDRDPDAPLEDHRRDVAFVDSATYCFVAASITRDPDHPLGRLVGDALVRLPSAAGRAPEPGRHIPFHLGHVVGGLHHLQLQNHPDVYPVIRGWLAASARGNATRSDR